MTFIPYFSSWVFRNMKNISLFRENYEKKNGEKIRREKKWAEKRFKRRERGEKERETERERGRERKRERDQSDAL